MENSIYTGLSRQVALRTQMDLIANNVANMSTPGYRSQNMVFEEYIADPRGIEDPLSQVLDYGHYQNTQPGPIRNTGNPLDMAVQGKGYLGIETQNGTMYTRSGSFLINNLGEVVTSNGDLVASEGGGAITVPQDAREISVAEDGTISTDQGAIGRVMVVEFEDEQLLEAMGNGYYTSPQEPTPAEDSRIMQGMIEGSNVNGVLEMTRMIDVLRSYQQTQNMLNNEDERQRSMIQRMTRSS